MPIGYDQAYEYLKVAQEVFDKLSCKSEEEKWASVRMGFMNINRAVVWASRNYEVSSFDGAFAQGGSYDQVRAEAEAFSQMTCNCERLLRNANSDELIEACFDWLTRAKGFIERTRAYEARATNLQYANIPEEQDYSIITKDGKPLRR